MSLTLTQIVEIAETDTEFIPGMSSNELFYADQSSERLTDVIATVADAVRDKADMDHTHAGYAVVGHEHTGYADIDHSHTDYASSNHAHAEYADIDHSHTGYASSSHTHSEYADVDHAHADYAVSNHVHSYNDLTDKPTIPTIPSSLPANGGNADTVGNMHASDFALADHSHTGYANSTHAHTQTDITGLTDVLATKADASVLSTKADLVDGKIPMSQLPGYVDDVLEYTAYANFPTAGESGKIYLDTTTNKAYRWSGSVYVEISASLALGETASTAYRGDRGKIAYDHSQNGSVHVTTEQKTAWDSKAAGDHSHSYNDLSDKPTIPETYVHPTSHPADMITGLADVATSGSYNDLTNKPTIPAAYTHPASHPASMITGLADVATSGDYNDLANKPSIPTIPSALPANGGNADTVDGKHASDFAASGHNHNGVYYTETEIDTMLSGKANVSHGTHVTYSTAAPVMDGTAAVGTASTVARSDHKHPVDTSRAAQADLTSHTGNKSNPHGVTLAQLGVTATAAELNYVDGVTSSIQTQLNSKAASGHTHNYAGSSSAGGAATSANKLATARTITLSGDVTGSTSFDGSGNVTITTTVADDSHNHTIANVDGLQAALDGKSATSHTHSADAILAMAGALFCTNATGGVEYSYGSGSGKNVLTEISNMPQGFHTVYAIAGTAGNPETTDSYRYFIHKTSDTICWLFAFAADGSIYSNYMAGANSFKGWRTIYDVKRKPLWVGSYYMTAGHSITPSKKLSECAHGWILLWSDYDSNTGTVNNSDFCTTMIPNRSWAGATWNGSSYYCDVPSYSAGSATNGEQRVIKLITLYDNKIVGTEHNGAAPRNDVVLRAVYEF